MKLRLIVYSSEGKELGSTRVQLLYHNKKWNVVDDPSPVWEGIGFNRLGSFEIRGPGDVALLDAEPGKPPSAILSLSSVPASDMAKGNAGTGKLLAPKDPAFAGGWIFWAFEITTVRSEAIAALRKLVPVDELDSDMQAFEDLLGYDTERLKKDFWENKEKPNPTFTCCNMFLGEMARRIGRVVGKQPGTWLNRGVLQLDLAGKDVPGSWITPGEGRAPQPGDFYSVPYQKGTTFQQFGHVGIVAKIENGLWTSLDGGQGGYLTSKKDKIKWVKRGLLDPSKMNGWIDIDIYFASAADAPVPKWKK